MTTCPRQYRCTPNLPVCTYKWEALRIHRAGLNQEFVPPAIQGIETLRVVHVVYEHAAVGTAVEGNTERLEALLTGSVPELSYVSKIQARRFTCTHLHGNQPVVDQHFLGQEIGTNRGFVACAELLVDL